MTVKIIASISIDFCLCVAEHQLVQLWTTGNYHWYLKLEILAPGKFKRFTAMLWHPENPFRMLCSTKGTYLIHLSLFIKYFTDLILDSTFLTYPMSTLTVPPHDTGLVAVVDGGIYYFALVEIDIAPSMTL